VTKHKTTFVFSLSFIKRRSVHLIATLSNSDQLQQFLRGQNWKYILKIMHALTYLLQYQRVGNGIINLSLFADDVDGARRLR